MIFKIRTLPDSYISNLSRYAHYSKCQCHAYILSSAKRGSTQALMKDKYKIHQNVNKTYGEMDQ